ncbi:MAG: HDOD domain-containing protein [Planctomycetota bacterium]
MQDTAASLHDSASSFPLPPNDGGDVAGNQSGGLNDEARQSLEQIIDNGQLPALPHSAIALLQLSQNPNAGPAEFAPPILADPGLTGQVLRFVNSSFFGFSREIASVQQALSLIGTRAVTNFALWNAVFSVIPNPQFGQFDLKSLWQDSLRRANLSRALASRIPGCESDDVFVGALLQDMAIPLLMKSMPREYEQLLDQRESGNSRLSDLEKDCFGWTHADAAGLIAAKWKLPQRFIRLVQGHTDFEGLMQRLAAGDAEVRDTACVALAALVPSCRDNEWPEMDAFFNGFEILANGQPLSLLEICEEVDDQTSEYAPLLQVPVPSVGLAEIMRMLGLS